MIDHFRAKLGSKLYRQFQDALDVAGNVYTPEDIIHACLAGEMMMVHGRNAVSVVQVQDFPRCRVMHVLLAAGDLGEILGEMTDYLRHLARHNGCDRLTLCGRRGWEREAARVGGRPTQILMTLHLDDADNNTNNEVQDV